MLFTSAGFPVMFFLVDPAALEEREPFYAAALVMECAGKKGGIMVEPLIFISTFTLKEGKLEDFKQYSEEFAKFIEENEPRLIHFEQYTNEDGTEVAGVQIHPDMDSMAFHMQLIREHIGQAFEFLDVTKSYQVYGEPSDDFVEQLKQTGGFQETRVPEAVIVKSKFSGFNRLPATAGSEPAS